LACKGGGSNNHEDMPGFGRHIEGDIFGRDMSDEIVSMLITYRLPELEIVPLRRKL